ncbi:MAG: N-acetylmuramoyl-L-alanine amidase, partial [Hyphomicrobiales bacterium]
SFINGAFAQQPSTEESPAQLIGFQIAGDEEKVRLVLEVKGFLVPTGFLSSAPFRYAIDLPNAVVGLKGKTIKGDPGFLKSIKYGRNEKNELRLIVGAEVPFLLRDSFVVPKSEGQPTRLVFDFNKATQSQFRIAMARQAEEARLERTRETEAAAKAAADEKKAAEKGDAPTQGRRWRIVVDPGHGGKDGGAKTRKGLLEKEIVLSFAKHLASALSGSGRFDVILTRTSDKFVPLKERVRIGRENNADLFVSIHSDSFPKDRRVRGTAIYTISNKASDRMAAEIAAEQNQSDAIAGYEVKDAPNEVVDILFDLTRRETSNLSVLFARHFLNNMKGKVRFFKIPLQRGAFTVLRVPDVPSALIELGFLSNNADAELLSSEAWRERIALEMAGTIASYFKVPLAGLGE